MQLLNGSNERIRALVEEFPGLKFELYTAGKDNFITCLACWMGDSTALEESWVGIQSILALNFKSERKTARWNVYLAFFCAGKVANNLKYIIQNDKFTARKMVFDWCGQGRSHQDDSEMALDLLNGELFSTDLTIDDVPKLSNKPYDSFLTSYLSKYSMDNKEERLVVIRELIAECKSNEN